MWRNDVKDFMNNKNIENHTKEIELPFEVEEAEKIYVKLDRPDLIFGITYLIVPKILEEKYKEKMAIHPLTKEKLPIFFKNVKKCKIGVPAHVEEDYEFAIKKDLPIKQVIMPVNASLDENKPREDKPWKHRNNVVLIVKHWQEDKYLYIDYNKQNWKCFISGGVEENETFKEAAIRELKEESGYYDIKIIKEMPFKMANVFYAAHKGINRYSLVTSFYIELNSLKKEEISEIEKEEHTIKWEEKEKLYEILKNGFTDQIWLLKQLLGDIGAYTGNGKIINSDFLNDFEDREEAINKITEYLKVNKMCE